MDAIYDKLGSVVSWIGTGDNIFSLKGKPIAFIKEKNVWRFLDGHHLGTFKDGVFRDHNGSVVAFTDKAQNAGVFLPFKKLKPFEPFCQSVPFRPLTPYPPFCPINRMSWGLSWKDFINIDLGVI